MTLEYSDPRYKMRVGRTYFMTSNYKKHVSLLKVMDEDDEWQVSYKRSLEDNPKFKDEQ